MAQSAKDRSLDTLLWFIDQAYERKAWHGPNLKGSIRGVSFKEALWRPTPKHHNIWELMLHAAYWKYVVRRRITGEARGSFPYRGSNWFKSPSEADEKAWRRDVKLLGEQHANLRSAVARLAPSDLNQAPAGSKQRHLETIYGIASHDLYHAGQIQLLKRLQRGGAVKTNS